MTTKHTAEPWKVMRDDRGLWIAASNPNDPSRCVIVAELGFTALNDSKKANAERIVACVNACEGINPEAVPDALAAFKCLVDWVHNNCEDPACTVPLNAARAAITKAETVR